MGQKIPKVRKPSNDGNLGTRNDGKIDKRTTSKRHLRKCGHRQFVNGYCVDCGMPIGTAARQGHLDVETKKRPPTPGTGFDVDM